jgi:hypothetical protein
LPLRIADAMLLPMFPTTHRHPGTTSHSVAQNNKHCLRQAQTPPHAPDSVCKLGQWVCQVWCEGPVDVWLQLIQVDLNQLVILSSSISNQVLPVAGRCSSSTGSRPCSVRDAASMVYHRCYQLHQWQCCKGHAEPYILTADCVGQCCCNLPSTPQQPQPQHSDPTL